MKTRIVFFTVYAALAVSTGAALAQGADPVRDFTYEHKDGSVEVMKDGKVVARYVYKDTPKPYIYPLLAPSGEAVTREFPAQQDAAGKPADHPHHRSMWLAFGNVNGIDFWADGEKMGKIVQTSIQFDSVSPGYWNIHTTNDWIGPDGKKVLEEERRYSFLSCPQGTLISTMLMLRATEGEVKLNDTKEGFVAIRLAPGIAMLNGKGSIVNSEGQKGNDCWGKRARWVDYTGEVNGKTVGVTMFDVPTNHGYPTYWHARDYGLLAANPFGGKAYTSDEKNDSTYKINYGDGIRLVYITLIHDGRLAADEINLIADQVTGKGRIPPSSEKAGLLRIAPEAAGRK